jgi:transcription antitermination protein NusB
VQRRTFADFMLNRRLIRIKVYQAMFAMMHDEEMGLNQSIKNLNKSLSGMLDNFYVFLSFPIELAHYIRTDKNPKERKYISKADDTKHYEALIFDELYTTLTSNAVLKLKLERLKHNWSTDIDLLQSAYNKIRTTDFYESYCSTDIRKIENQIQFFKDLIDFMFNDFEEFDNKMEEIELRWEEERAGIHKQCMKMLDKYDSDDKSFTMPPLSKNQDEDLKFAQDLLTYSYRNQDDYQELIGKSTPGWDTERIAKSDLIFMILSITEFLNFPNIPPKVTLNEYLELAKRYSTPKSSKFLNGVLDRLMKEWKNEGKMIKKGRGLVE